MKKKIAVLSAVIIVLVALSMGCLSDYDTKITHQNIEGEIPIFSMSETQDEIVYTGVLKGVKIKNGMNDEIVFYNGQSEEVKIPVSGVEKFDWDLGVLQKVIVTSKKGWDPVRNVKDVVILNETSLNTQSVG